MNRMIVWVSVLMAVCHFPTQMSAANLDTESSSTPVTEQRKVASFETIELQGSPTIYYQQGKNISVKVVGNAEEVKNLVTEVKDGKLMVYFKSAKVLRLSLNSREAKKLKIFVTSPDLTDVLLMGSGDFKALGKIDTDKMTVSVKGSGDIEIPDLICDHLIAEVLGSGDLKIQKARTQTAKISLMGSGDVKMGLKKVKKTDATLIGSGDIDLQLQDCHAVQCHVRGSGDITLRGQVVSLQKSKTGSGDIDISRLTFLKK